MNIEVRTKLTPRGMRWAIYINGSWVGAIANFDGAPVGGTGWFVKIEGQAKHWTVDAEEALQYTAGIFEPWTEPLLADIIRRNAEP